MDTPSAAAGARTSLRDRRRLRAAAVEPAIRAFFWLFFQLTGRWTEILAALAPWLEVSAHVELQLSN